MAEASASGAPEPGPSRSQSKASRAIPAPPGNTGTHWTGPNEYLLAQLTRANYITSRRIPFEATPDNLCSALQRLVHYEGNRPPNRKILLHLRLLTYYPPNPIILAELITLIESENVYVCRLAHYHIRQNAPIADQQLYRDLMEALEREVLRPSPARRAAATKTLAKVFIPSDVARASDFVMDVFHCIGGARVKPADQPAPRKIAGIEVPGTDKNKKKNDKRAAGKGSLIPVNTSLFSRNIVAGESYDGKPDEREQDERERRRQAIDDGTGGVMQSARGNAEFIKSKFGKMLVGHTVFAAMRRLNRVAIDKAKVESYLFDSGLMSIVPSTVRHCLALLELRSIVSPGPVSRYLVGRLPHKNPPASRRLHLEELGARVYFARLLSALAEDPNLSAFIPDEAPKQALRDTSNNPSTIRTALTGSTYKEKASNLFKFLFNKERVSQAVGAVKSTTSSVVNGGRVPRLKRDDPLGVEFAEALVNLLKNASNRVLIEALRGLSRRRWTTWFEAPIPHGALYNSPELQDAEAYGGTADSWGLDDDDEDDADDVDDENELGAYENDVVGDDQSGSKGSLRTATEVQDPALDDLNVSGEKETWFSRLKLQRKERRDARINEQTPFYLRKVGQGMVPALEVILRRINAALLHDEPVRRFAAADAIIVLARAKIYGHTTEDHQRLRKAQSSIQSTAQASTSRALVTAQSAGPLALTGGSAYNEEKHPFQALVRPLTELVEEDPNQFVRGRAAVALLFIITAGAGRDAGTLDSNMSEKELARSAKTQKVPLLLRYFKSFVMHENAGSGIGLRLMSEVIDYLVYEVLDVAPELAPSAIEMAELWAIAHPTVGVCGRLGALWEKVLSIGQGDVVGKSIFRAVTCRPKEERVASAGVIFLRRRTLDLAIITVGSSQVTGNALPEPLPRGVGIEMERYFSLLWHAALLGPSAECRTFAVEALGGAAALAGEPFRCCTYERLVELVRMRGFGLKIPAEQVLNCLDMLYFSRERFSEARAKNRIARDGTNKSRKWLELVWRLAAESASAGQILLGVPPPTGWQPLGPSAAADLANAEERYGDVRDRQDNTKLKDASIALTTAPGEAPLLAIEPPEASTGENEATRKVGSGGIGDVPPNAAVLAYSSRRVTDADPSRRSRSRSRSRERSLRGDEYSRRYSPRREYADDVDYDDRARNRDPDHYYRNRRRSRSESPRNFRLPRSRSDLHSEDRFDNPDAENTGFGHRTTSERQIDHHSGINDEYKRRQEEADLDLARRLQQEEGGQLQLEQNAAQSRIGGASDTAGKLLSKGLRGGKSITDKAIKAAAKSGAMDKLRGAGSSFRR